MTGRENIFMNGAILGMTKAEIASKLDEIVDFSGCERYLDTPVKRYSSGMMVRLGFAVAAHLDPEILVVDEVLAVGDAEFQKKAIGKMQDVSKGEGRTVLFVSHNMASVLQLCNTGVLLEQGMVKNIDSIVPIVNQYVNETIEMTETMCLSDRKDREGNGKLKLVGLHIEDFDGKTKGSVKTGDSFRIHLEVENINWRKEDSLHEFSMLVLDSSGNPMFVMNDNFLGEQISFDPDKKVYDVYFNIDKLSLNKGTYFINVCISDSFGFVDFIRKALFFDVDSGNYFEKSIAITQGVGSFFHPYSIEF
jgi:lipopolysaccharide transport system ATP-binding protein